MSVTVPTLRPAAAPGRLRRLLGDEEGARRDAAFVAVTLAGLLLGLVGGWVGRPGLAAGGWGLAYVFGGGPALAAAVAALRRGRLDIDLLMVLAALGALAIGAPFEGAMLLFLFALSNTLQRVAVGRSRRAIRALMQLRPETAVVRRDGTWRPLPLGEVAVGEVFRVRPGDRLPLDGVVTAGRSVVDQAAVTGESVPVERGPGDEVFAGTIAVDGALEVRVSRPPGASTLARMIALVEEAQAQKAATQRLVDRYEQPYVVGVLALTALAAAAPVLLGLEPFAPAFYRAMTLMVAASPCALVLATPAAVLSAIASAARRGVLFKGGVHVETIGGLKAVAFDKTGTLTEGQTRLTDARPLAPGLSADALVALAAAVQARSEHHLARATVREAAARGLALPEASAFRAVVGQGVEAMVEGVPVRVGNPRLFADEPALAGALAEVARLQAEGRTAVLVARGRGGAAEALGVLGYADTLRPGAAAAVRRLRALGVERIAMLTGDNAAVAARVAAEAGVDEVHAELLPAQKVERVRALRAEAGPTAMVGDGVNDAPALAAASLGVAMGAAGTDVALETADVVLMGDDLGRLAWAVALGRATRRTIVVNLAFALAMILLMVASILAVGLPLPLAVVGHEGSTVLVALNGLRLLGFRERA